MELSMGAVFIIAVYIVAGIIGLVFLAALLRHIYSLVAAVLFLGSLLAVGYGALITVDDLQQYLDLEEMLREEWVLNRQWGMVIGGAGALVFVFVVMNAARTGAIKVTAFARGFAASDAVASDGRRKKQAKGSVEDGRSGGKPGVGDSEGGGPWG